MAETLGDALLYLRTDDSGFTAGVGAAEGKAVRLGATLDATSAKSGGLSKALTSTGGAAQTAAREIDAAAGSGARFAASSATVTKSSGAQAMGFRQLTQNIGDMSTMYALGMRPQQIFASQIGQVAQAIQLTAGQGSKFAAFLTGGWGIALMLAVQLLGPFIGALFETKNAADDVRDSLSKAADAADSFGNAQTLLGKVMDLVTGKFKTANEVLIQTIKLEAQANLLAAQADQRTATKALSKTGQPTLRESLWNSIASFAGADQGANARDAMALANQTQTALGPLRGVLDDYSKIINQPGLNLGDPKTVEQLNTALDQTLAKVDKLDKAGQLAGRNPVKVKQAILALGTSINDQIANQQALDALDGKGLAADLRQPGHTKKPPKDRSAEIASRNAAELARLGQEETRAQLDLTTNIDDRADLQMDLLHQERDERIREVENNKNLDAREKAARLALIERLYGKPNSGSPIDANGNIVVSGDGGGLYGRKISRDVREQEARLANDALSRQAAALSSQASIATNLKDRDALEQRALDLQQRIERNMLDQQIANGQVADADKARATLAQKQAAVRAGLLRSQEGPLAQYQDSIRATAENMGTEIEAVEVRGLQNLNDGLADAIVGAKNLGDVFHNVAQQIIGDLLRIAIQQQIIKPLASLLGLSGGGGGGGLFGSILGGLLGIGGGGGAGVLGSGFNVGGIDTGISFGGFKAAGGPVSAGMAYIVGEKRPEIFVPDSAGTILPDVRGAARGGAGGGRGDFNLSVTVNGARGNAEIQDMVSAGVRQGIAGYDQVVAGRVQDHLRRRS